MPDNLLSRILTVVMAVFLSATFFSCRFFTQPPRFRATQDMQMNCEIREFSAGREIVWKYVRETIRENYRLLREDESQGLILTQWRKRTVRGTGRMSARVMHGVKIDDQSDSPKYNEREEFELRNRLSLVVVGNADMAKVSVTNYYIARPKNYTSAFFELEYLEGDDVVKAYSMSDFDTREQYFFLNRIGELVERGRK